MAQHTDLGQLGEELAHEYLVKKGYKIRARNWHFNHYELDIVAEDGPELVVVEVKTRSATIYETLDEAISKAKIKFLVNAAEAYILENEIDLETRFDLIAIKWFGKGKYELEHIEDAFKPPVN
ncbi:MAG: YraN family protein [Prolixibacteraceae bacterium]|nr:YraN family protein [Prolixibacteraceae bacterium]